MGKYGGGKMTRYTQSQLKAMVKDGIAIDVTYADNETLNRKVLRYEEMLSNLEYLKRLYHPCEIIRDFKR